MSETTISFAQKLNELFDTHLKIDGTHIINDDVIKGTEGILTHSHLQKLRSGQALDPKYDTIHGLANFFGVDPGYFFEETEPPIDTNIEGEPKLSQYLTSHKTELDALDGEAQETIRLLIDSILEIRKKKIERL